MGQQTGIIRIKGKVGELTFSQKGDKTIVGRNSSLSKERILNDPKFRLTRQNMSEFAGASKTAAAIKTALIRAYKGFADKRTFNNLFKITREIINLGTGTRGRRNANLVANSVQFSNFNFHSTDKFNEVFYGAYSITNNADRNQIDISIPDFNTLDYLTIPQGATHVRFVAAIGAVSNYTYSIQTKSYEPVVPTQNGLENVVYSPIIPLGGMVGSNTNLQATLPGSPALDTQVLMLGTIGVEFILESNGEFLLMASGNALKVAIAA